MRNESKSCGALSINSLAWLKTGGITTRANKEMTSNAVITTIATDVPRFSFLDCSASTVGFKPMARNSEIIIKTKTWLADCSARSNVMATSAPDAARNPK